MRIRILGLKAHNGLVWQDLFLPLAGVGLALIVGPNGSGKTSIPELLSDAFYGKTFKSGTGNAVVNRRARRLGEGMAIEVRYARLEQGEWVTYRLLKTRNWKDPKTKRKLTNGIRIWRKGAKNPISPAKNTGGAQQKFAAAQLGMTWEEFRSCVYLPHRALHPLVVGTPTTRAGYITNTYGLERYDELHQAAKAELRVARDQVNVLASDRERLTLLTEELHKLPKRRVLREEQVNVEGQLEGFEDELANIETSLTRLLRKQERQRRRRRLVSQLQRLDSSGGTDATDARKVLRKHRRRKAALGEKLPELRQAQRLRREIKKRRSGLPAQPEHSRQHKQVRSRERTIEKNSRRLAQLEDRLEVLDALEGLVTCPTCGQSLHGTAADPAKISDVQRKIKRLSKTTAQLRSQHVEYEDYREKRDKIKVLREQLSELPQGNARKVQQALDRLDERIEGAEELLERLATREALQTEVAMLPRGRPEKTAQRIDTLQTAKQLVRKRINRLRERRAILRKTLTDRQQLRQDVAELQSRISNTAELEQRIKLLEALVFAFSNKGLKLERMRATLGEISRRLCHYTAILLPRYSFALAEKESAINFDVVERADPETPADVASLSAGEQKRLSLALLLTERDLRTAKIDLLFLDEFDGGLDDDGRDSLIETLSDLRDSYGSIFAISHADTIVGHSAFDVRYRISRQAHYSEIQRLGR